MKYRNMILAGVALQAGVANGMGLGNIDVQSYLGSPLQAHIGLLSPGDYQAAEIQVNLARHDVYNRFDARYEASHGDLQFDVITEAGQQVILVRSSKRIVEPFLDIVVELSWPTGTTYRRYNLLLDPPSYAARWRQPQPEVDARLTQAVVKAEPVQPELSEPDIALNGHYTVQSGDSLWKVARKFRALTGLSIQQTMDVLFQNNPQAFVNGDKNLIKLGASLSVPAGAPIEVAAAPRLDQIASESYPAAKADISFAAETPVAPVKTAAANIAPANTVAQASVSLPGATVTPSDTERLKAELAALQAERAELLAFQQQVRAEMANLQAQREQMRETIAVANNLKEVISREVHAQDVNAQTVSAESVEPVEEPVSPQLAVAQDLIGADPNNANQLIDKSGSGIWYLVGLVPLGVLIGLFGLRSRKVQQIKESEEIRDEDLYELVFGTKRDRSKSDSPDQVQKAIHQIKEKASHQESLIKETRQDEEASSDDVSQMIELYMLYNQYQKALAVIHAEIAKRPTRKDLRLYLMQVYARTHDWDAFDDQMDVLQRLGDQALIDQAEQLRMDYEYDSLQRDAG